MRLDWALDWGKRGEEVAQEVGARASLCPMEGVSSPTWRWGKEAHHTNGPDGLGTVTLLYPPFRLVINRHRRWSEIWALGHTVRLQYCTNKRAASPPPSALTGTARWDALSLLGAHRGKAYVWDGMRY